MFCCIGVVPRTSVRSVTRLCCDSRYSEGRRRIDERSTPQFCRCPPTLQKAPYGEKRTDKSTRLSVYMPTRIRCFCCDLPIPFQQGRHQTVRGRRVLEPLPQIVQDKTERSSSAHNLTARILTDYIRSTVPFRSEVQLHHLRSYLAVSLHSSTA